MCSTFAQDMMRENDMAPYDDHNLQVGDWGNPEILIPRWEIVTDEILQDGDVAAYKQQYSNATGHMGIVAEVKNKMVLIYAGSSQYPNRIIATNITYWLENYPMVIRRYIGKK